MRSMLVVSVAGLAVFLIAPSPAATNANPPAVTVAPHRRAVVLRMRTPPGACTIDWTGDYGSFVGIPDANDYAGAQASAILGGEDNEACDNWTAIGGGFGDVIANKGAGEFLAEDSFIGGGSDNALTGYNAFIGSGIKNESSGAESFVGAGAYNLGQGPGSFVGAGGKRGTVIFRLIHQCRWETPRTVSIRSSARGTSIKSVARETARRFVHRRRRPERR